MITRVPWQPGGASDRPGPVLVSLTDLVMFRRSEQVVAMRDGLRLRRSWPQMPGAVGMWLWWEAPGLRSGSVSVWKSEEDLRAFIRWAPHVEIMRRNRGKGDLASHSWQADGFDPAQVWSKALRLIATRAGSQQRLPGERDPDRARCR